MTAEVVASVDVTVPTAMRDVAHVKNCPFFAFQSRAPHFTTAFVCVCSVSYSRFRQQFFGTPAYGRDIFADDKVRKLCTSNKKNLAQPDEA